MAFPGMDRQKLKQYFDESDSRSPRPILTSLNGDQSWLISLPLPTTPTTPGKPSKRFFHAVTDPWLKGPASILSTWFLGLELHAAAAATDGNGVEDIIWEIEDAATGGNGSGVPRDEIKVDAIFIFFQYLDHLHQPTLVTFSPDTPVFATPEAQGTILGWNHFNNVKFINDFDPQSHDGWQSLHPGDPLPDCLNVFRLKGHVELNFASAIVWSHDSPDGERKHDMILNSPHGIKADLPNVRALLGCADGPEEAVAEPRVTVLAMLAARKDSYAFGRATTLGFEGSLALKKIAKPKYWVLSHDMSIAYSGFFFRLIGVSDVGHTIDEVRLSESGQGESIHTNMVEVGNGASFVLE